MTQHFVTTPLRFSVLQSTLAGLRFGRHIHRFGIVDSTQRYAVRLANEIDVDGTLVIADAQSQGRGQRDNQWSSPSETGVYLSVIVDHRTSPALLAAATGLALVDAALTVGVPAGIKWPNDLVVANGKAGGVLAEALTATRAIIGIGVNLIPPAKDQLDGRLPVMEPVGLWLPGATWGREDLVVAILRSLERRLAMAEADSAALCEEFAQADALKGRMVILETNGGRRSGTLVRSHPLEGVTLKDEAGRCETYRAEWTRIVAVAEPACES